jgi:hypothetical protein
MRTTPSNMTHFSLKIPPPTSRESSPSSASRTTRIIYIYIYILYNDYITVYKYIIYKSSPLAGGGSSTTRASGAGYRAAYILLPRKLVLAQLRDRRERRVNLFYQPQPSSQGLLQRLVGGVPDWTAAVQSGTPPTRRWRSP